MNAARRHIFICAVFMAAELFFALGSASALPFNEDMVNSQMRVGSIMKAPPAGSIPYGSLNLHHAASKEEAMALQNPFKGDADSMANGRRLYWRNCYPCHGDFSRTPFQPGPVGQKTVLQMGEVSVPFAPPDLGAELYKDKPDGKSDGYLYGVIEFGGAVMMPALGWKFSDKEHWDIINFIRHLQSLR